MYNMLILIIKINRSCKFMGIFANININLYEMYFKKFLGIKNRYDYLKILYQWNPKAVEQFEKTSFDRNNKTNKWFGKKIAEEFFIVEFSDENILTSPHLFDIVYSHLKNALYLTNSPELSDVIRKIIYESETSVKECFTWDRHIQNQMELTFEKYNSVQVLSTLLIYAQTKKIYTPDGEYQLKKDFSYIKAYKKEVINNNFRLLFNDTVEVNMSQISLPSLMDNYTDYFKKNNKTSIVDMLAKNPDFRLNILLIDPKLPNIDILMNSFMYGDSFSEGVKVIEDSINFASELKKQFPNQVKVKTIALPMSYSFMEIKNKNSPSVIKIDVYTPCTNADDRFSIVFDNIESKELYDYYLRTFYRMFNNPNAKIIN